MAGAQGDGVGHHRHLGAGQQGLGAEHLRGGLFKGKGAADVHKVRNAQRGIVKARAHDGACHVQQDRFGARGQLVTGHVLRIAGVLGEAGQKVQRGRRARGGVELEVNAAERKLEVFGVKAVQGHAVGVGLGGGVADTSGRLDLQHAKVNVVSAKAVQRAGLAGKGLAGVKARAGVTHEDVNVRPAHGKALGRGERCGHRQTARFERGEVRLQEGNGALYKHEL